MVSLDIRKPIQCLDYPCMHTIIANGMATRYCAATHRPLTIISESEIEDSKDWMDVKSPEWCPWIEN